MEGFVDRYYPSILREVAQVYVACGLSSSLSDESVSEERTHVDGQQQQQQQQIETEFKEYVDTVLCDTAQNRSSMLQDVDPTSNSSSSTVIQTEVDYLSGYVVRMGKKHGIECPVNKELCDKVRALHTIRDG